MRNRKSDDFIKHTFIRYLVPTVIGLLGTTLSSFGNTLLAGRFLGKEALSMMSILSSFTFLYAMLGCLISIGASTRASIALGKEDYHTAAEYEGLAFILSFVVPLLLSIPCLIWFDELFIFLGASTEECIMGAGYGRLIIAFGFLNTLMYFPFNFLRLIGKGRYGMYSFGSMGILDIALVYLFLKLGMGPLGLAFGYILSMLTANVAGIWFLLKKNGIFQIRMPQRQEIFVMLISIFSFGSAAAINNLCKMLRTVLMNMIVSRYLGRDGVSSLAVGFSIINLASATVTGFGQAVSPIIGVFHGEHDRKSQRETIRVSIIYAVVFHAFLAIIIALFAPVISEVFGITDRADIRETSIVVGFAGLSLIPSSVMNILIYCYNATGENRGARILTVMHAFVLIVAASYIHILIAPSNLYAFSFITAELLDFVVMMIYAWIRRKRSPNLTGIMLEESEYAEVFFSAVSVGTRESAVEVSERVGVFCEENNVNPALCLKLPLVVEELLVVLASHCCDEGKSDIDLKFSLTGDKVIMRLRCEGRIFNPIDWFNEKKRTLSPEDFINDESFGMNVVDKVVNSVNYSNIFDVNNLIVTMGVEK